MDTELNTLAQDIVETIEKEDAFDDAKKQGGFVVITKAKDIIKGVL